MLWPRLELVDPNPSLPRVALVELLEEELELPLLRETELDCAERLVAARNELESKPLEEALDVLEIPELSLELPV